MKLAQIESDGLVSVIREDWAEPLTGQDLERALRQGAGGAVAAAQEKKDSERERRQEREQEQAGRSPLPERDRRG